MSDNSDTTSTQNTIMNCNQSTFNTKSLGKIRNTSKITCKLKENKQLTYEINSYSSYSNNYVPENVLVDCPNDKLSRWSPFEKDSPQYLILKLCKPAVVRKIKFGKFEESHECNMKNFSIFGGLHNSDNDLLLKGILRNDNIPEIFDLRCDDNINSPILYIKVVPISSWEPNQIYCIWYIELLGEDDPMYTSSCMRDYNKSKEEELIRLCLKHFREQGYDAAFKALQEQTHVKLEHPKFTKLYEYLVVKGDFEYSEQFITSCIAAGLMDECLTSQEYRHKWRLQPAHENRQPDKRGGHQLVVDSQNRLIYLFGGWNGYEDLSDLWVFDLQINSWKQIFKQSEQFNGPTPRSCHKMIFDPLSKNIFMLGRYLSKSVRTFDYIKSDFYLYDTMEQCWLKICDDTNQYGGPKVIYDHQMCIDVDKRIIYVFGGKVLSPRNLDAITGPEYSGLFSYNININIWTKIAVDYKDICATIPGVLTVKSRITHCMVFHNKKRKLYIYGGQRDENEIHDFITYDVDTKSIEHLHKNPCYTHIVNNTDCKNHKNVHPNKINEPPPSGLRATIDCERNEIYIFSSLGKIKERRDVQTLPEVNNSFWVYSIGSNTWSKIYSCRYNYVNSSSINIEDTNKNNLSEPCPRFAHQLVYDDHDKLHYLFGGNPGIITAQHLRLNDFWILDLYKPAREEILKPCRYLLRRLHYEELTISDKTKAIKYLRTNLAEVIDRDNKKELEMYHKLASLLFETEDDDDDSSDCSKNTEDSFESCTFEISDVNTFYSAYRKLGGKRTRDDFIDHIRSKRQILFNALVQKMSSAFVQPEHNLSDFFTY